MISPPPTSPQQYCNNPGAATPTFLGQLDITDGSYSGDTIFFTDATEDYAILAYVNRVGQWQSSVW